MGHFCRCECTLWQHQLLVAARQPIALQGTALQVSASIGISRYPQDGHSATEILATADQAMYHAKLAGRDSYRFFSAEGG